MLTIEKIFPKRILGIHTSGINELDFKFLFRRKDKDLFQSYFVKMIVSRDSSMKKFELKFSKFCFVTAFKSQ